MVFQQYHYRTNSNNNMGSLWKILNNDEPAEDVASLQQQHQGFVFSLPNHNNEPHSPIDSSDIAIQTLHALADLHHIKKERHYDSGLSSSSPSPSSSSNVIKSESHSPRSRSWDNYNNNNVNNNNNPNNNNNNNLANGSRRDYKKKQLVIRPELMQMKQAKAAVKLGIPPSTFSKRWRESLPDRKWPYRVHKKVEKSIQMLKVLQDKGHDVTADLKRLMTQRELNLKPAVITMFEDVNEHFELDTTTPSSSSSSSLPSSSSSDSAPSSSSSSTTPLSITVPSPKCDSSSSSPLTPSSPAAQVPLGGSDDLETQDDEEDEDDEERENGGRFDPPLSVPNKRRRLSKSDDEN